MVSAADTPPADQAFRSVQVAEKDFVGPIAGFWSRARTVWVSSALGTMCVAIPKLARQGPGDWLSEHGKARCPSPTNALSEALQGSGDGQHPRRHFDAT